MNIALGNGSPSLCAAENTDHITVDRILAAVDDAWSDCGMELATPAATPTPTVLPGARDQGSILSSSAVSLPADLRL